MADKGTKRLRSVDILEWRYKKDKETHLRLGSTGGMREHTIH